VHAVETDYGMKLLGIKDQVQIVSSDIEKVKANIAFLKKHRDEVIAETNVV